MPPKIYKKKLYKKKRNYKKKVMKRLMKPKIKRLYKVALPNQQFFKLKYDGILTYSNSSMNNISYLFRLNDLYDPDYSGGGHQPFYFDQLCTTYTNFYVYGSSIAITCSPASLQVPLFFSVTPYISSTYTINDYTEVMENKRARYAIQPVGSQITKTIKSFAKTSSVLSVSSKEILNDDKYKCTASSSPTNQCYWHIKYGPLDYNTYIGATQIMFNVKIVYYVRCALLLDITQS